eukprot:9678407-Alexandrium_andersonii.AAC.1
MNFYARTNSLIGVDARISKCSARSCIVRGHAAECAGAHLCEQCVASTIADTLKMCLHARAGRLVLTQCARA